MCPIYSLSDVLKNNGTKGLVPLELNPLFKREEVLAHLPFWYAELPAERDLDASELKVFEQRFSEIPTDNAQKTQFLMGRLEQLEVCESSRTAFSSLNGTTLKLFLARGSLLSGDVLFLKQGGNRSLEFI